MQPVQQLKSDALLSQTPRVNNGSNIGKVRAQMSKGFRQTLGIIDSILCFI